MSPGLVRVNVRSPGLMLPEKGVECGVRATNVSAQQATPDREKLKKMGGSEHGSFDLMPAFNKSSICNQIL